VLDDRDVADVAREARAGVGESGQFGRMFPETPGGGDDIVV